MVLFKDDAKNLFVVITARALNPDLYIASVSNSEEAVDKLYKVGANKVISPDVVVGRMISRSILKPHMMDFYDKVSIAKNLELAYFSIVANSPLINKTLKDANIRNVTGTTVLAINRHELVTNNPPALYTLEENDVITSPESKKYGALYFLSSQMELHYDLFVEIWEQIEEHK